LGGENHPAPRVINTDKHAAYPPAIVELKADGVLEEKCTHRSVQYLNNVLEQDHRAIKRRVRASQHFRSFTVQAMEEAVQEPFGGDEVQTVMEAGVQALKERSALAGRLIELATASWSQAHRLRHRTAGSYSARHFPVN
jgi:DDE domain